MRSRESKDEARHHPSVPEDIRRWNETSSPYPSDRLVHELFAEVARRSPDRTAVTGRPGGELTYGELLQRVERLAGTLGDRGIGPGDVVAVALERSVEGCVAMLGIMTSGAAYLPLDLYSPASRQQEIIEDAACPLVVTSADGAEAVPDGVERLDIGGLPEDAPAPSRSDLSPDDPAYVIYTSGSTGTPKGVVVPHRGVVRLVRDNDPVGYREDDVVCATCNLSFDISAMETFGALLNGARLVVPGQEVLLSQDSLEALLHEEDVTMMWLGAALFHQFTSIRPEMFGSLRCLLAGGDALNPNAVRAVLEHGRPGRLVDGYGPSENTGLSTVHVVDELPAEAESVPIGCPISNSTAYVVRSDGSLADIGERGELWVGGDGVALGYLNRPELTAERFVPDPFVSGDDRRIFKTGDIARWRRDGVLEFFGRRDRQVKLRGFRVELREIEVALSGHPQVDEAVVDVDSDRGDDGLLLGWVTSKGGASERDLPMRLRTYLRDRLPVFMVPQEIRIVASMPMNSAGKVDRDALWSAQDTGASALPEERRPKGRVEEAVAEVWREMLGLSQVSRDDEFFELGGQSLHATQTVAALSERLEIDAARGSGIIRALLENPSVASFAAATERIVDEGGAAPDEDGVDFQAEATLDPALRFDAPPAPADPCEPVRVLLTGATGFLGVFLLDRLVAAGVQEIWCLTRAQDEAHARRRIAGRMRRYGLDYEKVRDRVVPITGDLSKPGLGMEPADRDRVARSVDTILHSGSLINFAYPYGVLRDNNVGGTAGLLELAGTHRTKPFHYVSTITVIAGFGTAGVRFVAEDRPLEYAERISLGYPETKWVAENLVQQAAERGLPMSIYRPYEITGTRDRGIWNTDTLMCAWFRTIAETGMAPDVELPLDFVPVDYTAEAITHILTHERPTGDVFHLANPHDARLGLLVERLRHMGYPVETVPYEKWAEEITALTKRRPDHPMTPFMPMFNEKAADASISVKEMYFAGTFPEFGRANTDRATADAHLDLPPVDAKMIDLYLRYFIDSGFLAPPPEEPAP
ncbi:non-ribosomal peptide synthetase family protein [Actinomadura terrae]|uniref:non-ribosomal peptide synthetase family protein n=1 Tax=Actinomadura terrae TaxID=604353 RepID=UPI001FA6FBF7|nr:amino acid adenylation domain-containing protein [Actinomadura terrae]